MLAAAALHSAEKSDSICSFEHLAISGVTATQVDVRDQQTGELEFKERLDEHLDL